MPSEPPEPRPGEPAEWIAVLVAAAREVESARDLPGLLYLARRAFALAGLACDRLTHLRPVEYLEPLADARDAAVAGALTLDQAPSAPPPPPLEPDEHTQVMVVGAA